MEELALSTAHVKVRLMKRAIFGVTLAMAAWLAAATAANAGSTNAFFAFCMDTHDAKQRSLQNQAALLKELGYDGCGHLWLDHLPERLKTLDAAGLKLYQVYLTVNVATNAKQPYDARLKDLLPLLKGRDVQIALLLQGAKSSDSTLDEHVANLVRGMAAMAETNGVRIVLYPHITDWLETINDAVRVAAKIDRPNVGVMFNFCHWLRVGQDRDYQTPLKQAMPRLFAVSINGADEFDTKPGWKRYVQPLDSGNFDMAGFLTYLRNIGYTGPIGLQCYGLGGDARDHLTRSITAWRRLNAK